MCSRYELDGTFEEIELRFCIVTKPQIIKSFNGLAEIRPTDQIPIITNKNEIAYMRWGLALIGTKAPSSMHVLRQSIRSQFLKPYYKTVASFPQPHTLNGGKMDNLKLRHVFFSKIKK